MCHGDRNCQCICCFGNDIYSKINFLFQPTQDFFLLLRDAVAFAGFLDGFCVDPGRKFAALDVGECRGPLLGKRRRHVPGDDHLHVVAVGGAGGIYRCGLLLGLRSPSRIVIEKIFVDSRDPLQKLLVESLVQEKVHEHVHAEAYRVRVL